MRRASKTKSSLTVGELFLGNAVAFPQRRFIYTVDQEITYQNATVRIANIVEQLKQLGVSRGSHLLCYEEMPIVTLDYFLAAQFIGAVFVPISPVFSIEYALEVCSQIDAKLVLCASEHAEFFRSSGVRALEVSVPSYGSIQSTESAFNEAKIALLRAHADVTSEHVIILQPTAGSTGKPKLVVRKHGALTHYASHLVPHLFSKRERPHRYLLLLSMAHSFGYHQFTSALTLGAEIAIPDGLDTSIDVSELNQLEPTILPMPPRVLASIVSRELMPSSDSLSPKKKLFPTSAEYVVIGGGKANPETLRRLFAEGVKPIEIYSTSETSMIAITAKDQWRDGTAGIPLPSVKIKFGPDGEMLIKSPGMMLGYFKNPEANQDAFTEDGYYRSGDIGALEPSGALRYLSRKCDVFNTPEGSNIYPIRIEQKIEEIPGVSQAVLVGDGRPYLVALIVVEPSIDLIKDSGRNVDPKVHAGLYKNLASSLEQLNSSLERVEKVIRFTLLCERLPTTCYQFVSGGKVRRNRESIAKELSTFIEPLYQSVPTGHATCVPGVERRLRPKLSEKVRKKAA